MKLSILLLPLAFIIGGLTGMWGYNEKLRATKTTTENRKAVKVQPLDSFARMINIPETTKRKRANTKPKKIAKTEKAAKESKVEENTQITQSDKPEPPHYRNMTTEDLASRIKEASELWRTRMEMVRAGILKTLDLSDEEVTKLDSELEKMNENIRASVLALADAINEEGKMTQELGVRFMGEISISIAETYDRIGNSIKPENRSKVGDVHLVELIDPSVAEPLINVQHKLGDFSAGGFGR